MALSKEEILDAIGALTVIELSELLTAFEEKFGVTAAAPVAVAAVCCARRAPASSSEKSASVSDFTFTLKGLAVPSRSPSPPLATL